MKTSIAPERILIFKPQVTKEEAKDISWKKKMDAFGAFNKVASFLSRPKDDDFELVYTELRYEPFWHVKGHSRYVYDRKTQYQWQVSGKEVSKITIEGTDYTVDDQKFTTEAIDHCNQEEELEVFVEGISGDRTPRLSNYLQYAAPVVSKDELITYTQSESIFVPPKARVSALVREVLAGIMKVIQADEVFEETVELSNVDLYYHPIYAFQYKWLSKQKEAIVQIDALTGDTSFGHKTFKEYLGKALDQNFLFDVGADAAGMFVPGGSIAVKLAKKYIETKKK